MNDRPNHTVQFNVNQQPPEKQILDAIIVKSPKGKEEKYNSGLNTEKTKRHSSRHRRNLLLCKRNRRSKNKKMMQPCNH